MHLTLLYFSSLIGHTRYVTAPIAPNLVKKNSHLLAIYWKFLAPWLPAKALSFIYVITKD